MLLSSIVKSSSSKVFPDFIRNSNVVYNDSKYDKIFPKIGLPNSKEDINVKFDLADVELDKVIHLAIRRYISYFHDHHRIENLRGLHLVTVSQILYIFEELSRRFTRKIGIKIGSGTVKLAAPIVGYDGKPLLKAGTDCFKLVKKLLELGERYAKIELISGEEIASECKNLQIVFSSSDLEGAWDLVTMSMRGVKSCMRWEASQSRSLVGTLIDPCCGIIYLTNGSKTKYGPKMLFRALVRLVFNRYNHEPALLVDRLYSSFYKIKPNEYSKLDEQIKSMFIQYIQTRIPKMKLLDCTKDGETIDKNYVLAMPPSTNLLSDNEFSYLDTKIPYDMVFTSVEPAVLKSFGINTTKPTKRSVKTIKTKAKPKVKSKTRSKFVF